jgi:hypothetical protein
MGLHHVFLQWHAAPLIIGNLKMASTLQSSHDCTIIDVDDNCFNSPTRADLCGLLRNSAGAWIMGFYSHIVDHTDIFYAELQAIHHGLSLA